MNISPANSGQVKIEQLKFGNIDTSSTQIATAATQSYTCFDTNLWIRSTATPNSGYRFDRWTLTPTSVPIQTGFSLRTNPIEFKNTDVGEAGKTLTVYFTGGTATPPNPPTNVLATDGTYSDRVNITWNASTNATSYEVYRATSASGSKTKIGNPSVTSYADFSITCPNIYYYWIKAVGAGGASDFSSSNTGYCQGSTPPPPPPPEGVTPVNTTEAKKMLDERVGLIVVDASDPRDYEREHILCARNSTWESNFGSLNYMGIGLTPYKASDILVYDQKNTFGQTAAEFLAAQGFSSVYYLTGGLEAWIAAGGETVPCTYECDECDLPPMSHAGADRTASENQTFTLNGSGSVNPGAGSLTYSWKQYQGTNATITNPGAAQPTVRAPYVQEGGETLTFHLTVTDAQGNKDMDSVAVSVTWNNRSPVADAGGDQDVDGGVEVVLDGRDSTDPDGDSDIDTYRWVQTGGPDVALTGAATSVARFTSPLAENDPLELVFALTVTDVGGQSDTDEVTITVRIGNQPPVAYAGPDQNVGETAPVILNGSGSTDPDGDLLFYEWRQIGTPAVVLMQSTSVRPTFTAPMVTGVPLALTFELTVRDNKGGSGTDRVVITVEDVGEPPFADAGRSQMVYEGDMVTLDGFGSFDLDGEIVSYQWIQVNNPAVTMIGEKTATASFMAPDVEEGQIMMIFQLTATDDTGLTDSDTVKIGVSSGKAPPRADAGPDQIVNEWDKVALSGSGSSDLTDTIMGYQWEQVSGPEVALTDPAVRAPEFNAPGVSVDLTALTFKLSVEYVGGYVSTDTVDIFIKKKNCRKDSSTCFISTLKDDM